ncbi:MAG: bifunctional nuclease family protein [Deltaproteobacteria bacterium]|nr:bifunctional nuclease family protein [Deltaproteobacteria bacterium]
MMRSLALTLVCLLAAPAARGAEPRKAERERADVEDVLATPDGQFVVILKTRDAPQRFLPIWIGENEAMAIRWRLDRYTPPRPLTLNLLETMMQTSNIKLVEINIDSLKGGVFLGRLHLRQSGRNWDVDARPSDAIGLALGRNAAIWVSRQVIDEAGVDTRDLIGRDNAAPERDTPRPGASSYEESL